ncbi:unnamed protein product (macronuclear) [Paramecium tetraurelia]|uniref:Trichohyalin-plectin-homology domain-containing protein n=1 Tax=Paramecium tetraurelia TaxID=5888 RepID=A0DHE1_PARTE|nr:uncharacterized protein GSPATT00016845001 [Paramecium tetraurelia]CAK82458.1 unnamed protein product [Paramecium tetraurelia]|eukprot:XP_001449855.1 hypothetical protein (macronuclear) [Paramecium tetraurelia strain d4-2]
MLPKKFGRTMHMVGENNQNQERLKQLILDNLIGEYAQNDQVITAYTTDFFIQYNSINAIRILREEVKKAVLKPKEEKIMLIQKLNQRIRKEQQEHQMKNTLISKQENNNQEKRHHTNQLSEQKQQQAKLKTDSIINDEKRKSIYKVDGSLDEWGAIIKYNTLQFQKEVEQEKKKKIIHKQKIKEDLDKQIAEKEKVKQKDKQDEILYYTISQQQLKDFERLQEQRNKSRRFEEMQEKLIRDQQVYFHKKQKKEQNVYVKQQEEEMLIRVKEEIKAEDQLNKRKKMEQFEKLQEILKQNENLRIKAKEEVIKSKQQERYQQEMFILKDEMQNQRKRREKQEQMNFNINNYSQQAIRYKRNNQELNETLDDYWPNNKNDNKLSKREKQFQLLSELEKQVQEKKRRYTQQESEKRIIFETELQEQRDVQKQEQERRNNIRLMYQKNAEELKKQILYGQNGSPLKSKLNPFEKMGEQELLQNKKVLKRIANDSSLGIQVKKTEISIPE